MAVEIREEPVSFNLHGISGDVPDRNYAAAGFKLMEGLWPLIKENALTTTGLNYWVYNGCDRMSTCVELKDGSTSDPFERVPVELGRYAYYKHVGPYDGLRQAYSAIDDAIASRGLTRSGVAVEKYGDWTEDASKLVTEVFVGLI